MITLADAKLNIRLADDQDWDDALIERMIDGATAYLERRTGWRLSEVGEVTEWLCGDGTRTLWLRQPVEAVTVDLDGTEVDPDTYAVRGSRLVRSGEVWRQGAEYAVTYDAGFAAGDGPPDLQQAVRLIVAGWYEHREAWATGTIVADHKHSVDKIVGAYERVRV